MTIDKDELHNRILTYLGEQGVWSLTKVASWEVRYHAEKIADAINRMPEKELTAAEAFAELAKASGGVWDDVDPDEYARKLREE